MLSMRIEQASLNAWPGLQQVLYDGWMLRFAGGYTKRANSVNPLFPSSLGLDEKIRFCEGRYAERGLPPIFRLTSFAAPAELDPALADRDYRRVAPTSVMHRDLEPLAGPPAGSVKLGEESAGDWLALFCQFSGSTLNEHQTHRQILESILGQTLFASLSDSGRAVACGLAVLEGDCVGLFDLVTDPACRNRGYGTELVSGLLAWARQHGARHAYLQVVEANAPARHLYADKLGFRPLYRYWYRVAEPAETS